MSASLTHCPLLRHAAAFTLVRTHAEWSLFKCLVCGVQFWWPLTHPGGSFYEAPIFRRGRLQWRQKMFLKHPPIASGRVLDVGCGLGNFLVAAHRKGFEVWGTDISENNIAFIKKNYGLTNVSTRDLDELIADPAVPRFDAITLFEVLEHVQSPRELLEKVRKLVRPGGYVVITTPNARRLGGVLKGEDEPPHHFWIWDIPVLTRFLKENKWQVVEAVEEPLGKDYAWRFLDSLRFFYHFKIWLMNRLAVNADTKRGTEGMTNRELPVPSKKTFIVGDFLVLLKDVVMTIVAAPLWLIGRIRGWKYWDLYIVAKLPN